MDNDWVGAPTPRNPGITLLARAFPEESQSAVIPSCNSQGLHISNRSAGTCSGGVSWSGGRVHTFRHEGIRARSFMGVRPAKSTRLSRANRRRRKRPSSLNVFDGHTRVTSASPGRLNNFWKVYRCKALGFLLAGQDNRACGAASATLRELTCPKVTAILPTWSVTHIRSPDGSALTLFQSYRETMTLRISGRAFRISSNPFRTTMIIPQIATSRLTMRKLKHTKWKVRRWWGR